MGWVKGFLTGFLRDTAGNVLPLVAISMVLSAAIVGGGIDMSRAYRVENRLQSACDSAVLAGRRAVSSTGYDDPPKAQADAYFWTNFDNTNLETKNTVFLSTSVDNGQTVTGTASTKLDLAVMQMFGFKQFALSVDCSAAMGVGNSDVMMVLDTTGSMGTSSGTGTRMTALRTAMKNFYTTVKDASAGTNARIRYGFVPYSSTVNVGQLLYTQDPTYLVNTYKIQSREPIYKWSTPTNQTTNEYKDEVYSQTVQYANNSTGYNKESKCNDKLPDNDGWVSNGNAVVSTVETTSSDGTKKTTSTTTRKPQKIVVYLCKKDADNNWYIKTYSGTRDYYTYSTDTSSRQFDYWNYRQLSYDVSSYKAFQAVSTNTGSNGAAVSSTWAGCIEERGSVSAATFAYSSINGITPSGASDLDLDSAPTSDDGTKWAPLWPEVGYVRTTSGGSLTTSDTSKYGSYANAYCPAKSQLLAEMTQTDFNSYADKLKEEGSTYLDIGMAWGGRLSSPSGIFKDNVNVVPTNGGEVSRHIIFMTDGIMEPNYSIQSAWGIEWHDQRVTDNGYSNDASRHTSRFLAICEAIKAKGIRIWAISFTSGTNSTLSTCATTGSYYNADNPTELNDAFQEIAKQVGELRITQ